MIVNINDIYQEQFELLKSIIFKLSNKTISNKIDLISQAFKEIVKLHYVCDITFTQYGKPITDSIINFNISHSKDVCTIVISDYEIGVDVQYLINKNKKKVLLSKEEMRVYEKTNIPLTYIWCAKESYLKAIGVGLNIFPSSFSVICGNQLVPPTDQYEYILFEDGQYYFCICKSRLDKGFIIIKPTIEKIISLLET